MKDPKPPTLLRLKPIVASARYQDALNLEGLDTVILDGAPSSPLAFAKISIPAYGSAESKDACNVQDHRPALLGGFR